MLSASSRARMRALGRLLYTSNPFYLLSAACVVHGVNLAVGIGSDSPSAATLWCLLAGFAVMLAAWSIFIVRWGQVWDDTRSLLLVVILLLVGLSVTFDDVLLEKVNLGGRFLALEWDGLGGAFWMQLAGWALAAGVSEGLLRGLRMRLAGWYRAGYHVLLGLFFLAPLLLAMLVTYRSPDGARLATKVSEFAAWGVAAFAWAVAAAIVLLVVPGLARGSCYLRNNGSPWQWPWYPMSVFVVLGLAAGLRTWYLSIGFDPWASGGTAFGAHFLMPLYLAGAALVLAGGLAAARLRVQVAALVLAPGALVLAVWPVAGPALSFREEFTQALAGPPFLALLGMMCLYAIAWWKAVPMSRWALSICLLTLIVVGPETMSLSTLVAPQPLPLWTLGLALAFAAVRRPNSQRCLLAGAALLAAATVQFGDTWFGGAYGLVPWHVGSVCMLLVGYTFRDRLAYVARVAGAVGLAVPGLLVMYWILRLEIPTPWLSLTGYQVLLVSATVYACWRFADLHLAPAAAANLALFLLLAGSQSFEKLRVVARTETLTALAMGGVFFVCAASISTAKAGMHGDLIRRLRVGWRKNVRDRRRNLNP